MSGAWNGRAAAGSSVALGISKNATHASDECTPR